MWETSSLAFYGGLLGLLAGLVKQFFQAFCPSSWGFGFPHNSFTPLFIEVIGFIALGAAVSASISAARNTLVQRIAKKG